MTRWCRGATLAHTSGTSADAAGDLNQEVTLRRVLRLRGARSRAPRRTGADRPTGRTAGGGSWLGTTDTSPRPKTVNGRVEKRARNVRAASSVRRRRRRTEPAKSWATAVEGNSSRTASTARSETRRQSLLSLIHISEPTRQAE